MPSLDPHSFADPTQATIRHIAFHLEPDFGERCVRVRARYTLDRPVRGSFFLDSRDVRIDRVEAGGRSLRWALDKEDPILGQRLHLMDLAGVTEFSAEMTAGPEASALQWLEPPQTAEGLHPFLYSQCQSCSARALFPCQDTPQVRFTYEADILAPLPLTAVMAAEASGEKEEGARRRFSFHMRQPIPSYLFAFAVGRLAFQTLGPRTGVWAEPPTLPAAAWEFAENEAKLEAGEGLFGPYLWDRYDLLIMPPAFPYGGMENPRLTFLNGCYVLGDRSGTYMVSHELAHAWTGNLVTNASWEDFWLNEGPTTYAETRLSEILEGIDAAELRTAGRVLRLQKAIDRLGHDSPMTCLHISLAGKSPDESYSDVAYFKGLLFFRQLERAVGRDRFDSFLRDYIETFRFRSIDSEGFLAHLQARLPELAESVDLRQWVFEPGLPEGSAEVRSTLLEEVEQAADAYRRGGRPTAEQVAGWTTDQRIVFLGRLLPAVPAADCAYFDSLFGMATVRDGGLLSRFAELAVRSGYREVLPTYEGFFSTVGRYSFHEPVFRALVEQDWSRSLARPLLERWRWRHHPHTAAALERILAEAGL